MPTQRRMRRTATFIVLGALLLAVAWYAWRASGGMFAAAPGGSVVEHDAAGVGRGQPLIGAPPETAIARGVQPLVAAGDEVARADASAAGNAEPDDDLLTGRLVTPEGQPAAAVPWSVTYPSDSNEDSPADGAKGETDGN